MYQQVSFTNIDAKIRNKIIAKSIPQMYKYLYHITTNGVYLGNARLVEYYKMGEYNLPRLTSSRSQSRHLNRVQAKMRHL